MFSVHFYLVIQNVGPSGNNPRFVQFENNVIQFGANLYIPDPQYHRRLQNLEVLNAALNSSKLNSLT